MGCSDSIEELSRVLRPISEEQDADAAVALLLKTVERDLKVLLVKRVKNPTDPWSGEIALPGGKRDSEDLDLKQTVIRETWEETNINLLDRCRFLGVMTALRSTRRPEIGILPFVVLLAYEPLIRLNKKELESFVWIPVKELVQNEGTIRFGSEEFSAYIVGSTVIWGLTYRILKRFLQVLGSR